MTWRCEAQRITAGADTPAVARAWAAGDHAPGLALWRRLADQEVTSLAVPDFGATAVDLAVAFSYDGSELARGEDLEGFVVHPLLDEEVRVALPRHHPLAGQELVSMTDLTDDEWI